MATRLYTLDEFLLQLHPSQRYFNIIYFDFRRKNSSAPFRFKSMRMLFFVMPFLIAECMCNIIRIGLEIHRRNLSEAKQVGAVWSIETLCLLRGIFLVLKYPQMLELCNDFDRIFPRTLEAQKRANFEKFAQYLLFRHRFLSIYAAVGMLFFISIPLGRYLLFYDVQSGAPVLDEYHQHASWFPWGLKRNHHAYPYMYTMETLITICAMNCIFTWDQLYTISVVQMAMHFDLVNTEWADIDAEISRTGNEQQQRELYRQLARIIKYHQGLYKLGYKLRDTFSTSLFLMDMYSGASICFHIYLIANTTDIVAIILFIFPCLVQVGFTYDNCYQASRIEEASSQLPNVLFQHNWYEGSPKYRKFVRLQHQFALQPFTLSGSSLFRIDMIHFRGTMTIAYQMFTFLQTAGSQK